MLILLPPSEGKSHADGKGRFDKLEPSLLPDAAAVIKHASRLKQAARMKFYGAKDVAKAKAQHDLNEAALHSGCIKALDRYTGVVYQHIDCANLTRRKDAEKRLLIVSSLFGLIAGGTQLPNYKLAMNPWLAKYWYPRNTERLRKKAGKKPVLSLLSQSYAKALDCEGVLTVDFGVQGGKTAAGHFGKAIKGRFVRWLIENRVNSPKDFGGFDEDGYRFDGVNFIQR